MDTRIDGDAYKEGINAGWQGLTRPNRRTYDTTPCAYLGLWVLTTSRGRGYNVGKVLK